MARRKINHYRRIMSKQIISTPEIKPGMMLDFRYTGVNAYDKNPLVLFIYKDDSGKNTLLHGININYLYEKDVQSIFESMSKLVDLKMDYSDSIISKRGYSQLQLEKNPKSLTGVTGIKLYEKIIKPKIFKIPRTRDCYRTYDIKKITSLRLINYKFDIIEKEIREKTKLSKHKLKTNELFKNVEEQEIIVKTENTK